MTAMLCAILQCKLSRRRCEVVEWRHGYKQENSKKWTSSCSRSQTIEFGSTGSQEAHIGENLCYVPLKQSVAILHLKNFLFHTQPQHWIFHPIPTIHRSFALFEQMVGRCKIISYTNWTKLNSGIDKQIFTVNMTADSHAGNSFPNQAINLCVRTVVGCCSKMYLDL